MTGKSQEVEDLFSASGGFDEAELVLAIQPFVVIQESTKEIFIKNSSLTNERQILIYGIAKKLLKAKGHIDNELFTAIEIVKNLKLKKGSVDPIFMKLKKDGLIIGKGTYEIPVAKIDNVISVVRGK